MILYVVATPIGNLEDLTLRAQRTLREADLILAEDTRNTLNLLSHCGITGKPVHSCYAANELSRLDETLAALEAGKSVALVSDAGTPTISDPGSRLVAAVLQRGHKVIPVAGPSALTAALSASGFKADQFRFLGFPPRKDGARRKVFETLLESEDTAVFYESPHRILKTLETVKEVLPERRVAVFRELTKLYEEQLRGTAAEVLAVMKDPVRGEIVAVIEGL